MSIFVGLNTNRLFADVSDNNLALQNLGLNIEDVGVLNGEGSETGDALIDIPLNPDELRTISSLDIDAQKELYALTRSVSQLSEDATRISDIASSLRFNIRIDDQIRAGAIKYKFYDFAEGQVRTGDISTSRVSSWSGDQNEIFYGGEVEVIPSSNVSTISLNELELRHEPEPLKFVGEADTPEQPTHLITLNVDGVDRQFYAMKGIPLVWRTFFQNATASNPNINPPAPGSASSGSGGSGLYFSVNPSGSAQGRWIIRNIENGEEYNGGAGTPTFQFTDSIARERFVELYYNPNEIVRIGVASLNISEIPNVVLPKLKYYNLASNDLSSMPDFSFYTPNLEVLRLVGNNLARARDANGDPLTANTQLNASLPASLLHLNVNGVFSDNECVDIEAACPNLLEFNMNSYFSQFAQRRMTGGLISPRVATTVEMYSIRNQPYGRLSNTVCDAVGLRGLDITSNNITGQENPDSANTDPVPIVLASTQLRNFESNSNSHDVVSVAGISTITSYIRTYSRNLPSGDAGNDVNSLFGPANANLDVINLFATDVAGNINTAFANLPALQTLDGRWTRFTGKLVDGSFSGSTNLRQIRFAGSRFDDADFFSTSSGNGLVFNDLVQLRNLFVYNNNNIRGTLPSFANNINLLRIYIINTGISGGVPLFSTNLNLQFVFLRNNNLTGPVPSFVSTSLRVMVLANNNLSGDFGTTFFDTPQMRNVRLEYNNLSGTIPSFEGAFRMQFLRLQGNNLSGYTSGSLSSLTILRLFDASNNNLSGSAAETIFTDLQENYAARPRGGVMINLSGNNFSENASDLSAETLAAIASLRALGWTIVI